MISSGSLSDRHFTILVIEDNRDDAFLVLHAVKSAFPNAASLHVPGRKELEALLATGTSPDIVLSDWSLPQFDGLTALNMVRGRGIEAPFIIVSGKIGEEAAVMAIRSGAYDYVLKDALGRLSNTILHALEFQEHEKLRKKSQAMDGVLEKAAGLAKSPEGYCLNVIGFLKESCPEIRL